MFNWFKFFRYTVFPNWEGLLPSEEFHRFREEFSLYICV